MFWNPGGFLQFKAIRRSNKYYDDLLVLSHNNHFTKKEKKAAGRYRLALFIIDGLSFISDRTVVDAKAPGEGDKTPGKCCQWYRVFAPRNDCVVGAEDSIDVVTTTDQPGIEVRTEDGYRIILSMDGKILSVEWDSDAQNSDLMNLDDDVQLIQEFERASVFFTHGS